MRVEAEGGRPRGADKVDDLVARRSGTMAAGGELRRSVDALRDEW